MIAELELESPIVVVVPPKQRVKFNLSSPLRKTLMWGLGLNVGSHFENAPNLGIYDNIRRRLFPLPKHIHKIKWEVEEYHSHCKLLNNGSDG
jgi:hypothetical protein